MLLVELVPFLFRNSATAAWSFAFSVTAKLVPLVISTFDVVSVRLAPPSPLRLSLVTSMSLAAPLSFRNPVPVTVRMPVVMS